MAKEPVFLNLPEKKTCPICKKEFPRPIRNGRPISDRVWAGRIYCSRKCMIKKRRNSNDDLFR